MYEEFLRLVEENFDEEKELKRTSAGGIWRLRHKKSGRPYLFRRYEGSGEVYRKLIDRLAEKWSDQNIRTKPRFAALFCRQHPEAYEEICSYNADFAQKYQMDDNGKLIKRKG